MTTCTGITSSKVVLWGSLVTILNPRSDERSQMAVFFQYWDAMAPVPRITVSTFGVMRNWWCLVERDGVWWVCPTEAVFKCCKSTVRRRSPSFWETVITRAHHVVRVPHDTCSMTPNSRSISRPRYTEFPSEFVQVWVYELRKKDLLSTKMCRGGPSIIGRRYWRRLLYIYPIGSLPVFSCFRLLQGRVVLLEILEVLPAHGIYTHS